jgi:hypothetical protein
MLHQLSITRSGLSLVLAASAAFVGCVGDSSSEDADTEELSAAVCASASGRAENVSYATGAVVQYQGKVYRCRSGHTTSPAGERLWKRSFSLVIGPGCAPASREPTDRPCLDGA